MAKLSKKQATIIANLITDLTMASDAVSRQCAKETPDSKALTFWMADHDATVLKLREALGLYVTGTYAEIRTELAEAA